MACVIHPGSPHVTLLGGRGYCAACQTGIRAAVARLDPHVTPPDCFVWYKNTAEGWTPISGTGCAHYVAHQLNIHNGSSGDKCLAGYTYRVPMLLTHLTPVTGGLSAVRVGDVWVNTARSHTGIVSRIDPAPAPTRPQPRGGPAPPILWITNASSGQHKLATDRFDVHFGGQGDFFR